jgi:hypothetical protein
MAERCFPGIRQFYAELDEKPATFLQLLWAFEAKRAARPATRKRSSR